MALPVFSTIILGVTYRKKVEEALNQWRSESQIATTFFNFSLSPSFSACFPGAIRIRPAPIGYATSELKMISPEKGDTSAGSKSALPGTQCHRATFPLAGCGCTTITIISAEIIPAEWSRDETDASG